MTCLFELALKRWPYTGGMTSASYDFPAWRRWTWIIDMRGFGVANLDPRTSIKLLHLLQVGYRGRLKRAIILDAPLMFDSMWNTMITPFVKERTAQVIQFKKWSGNEEECRRDLEEMLGRSEPSTIRLMGEIVENGERDVQEAKTWTTFWALEGRQQLVVASDAGGAVSFLPL